MSLDSNGRLPGAAFGALMDVVGGDLAGVAIGILEASSHYVALTDPAGVIFGMNRYPPGVSQEAIVGRTLFDFALPPSHASIRDCLAKVFATRAAAEYDAVGAVPGLVGREARVRLGPIFHQGEVVGLVAIISDMTSRNEKAQALASREQALRVAVEASALGMWSWERGRNVVEWDDRICAIYGRTTPLNTLEEFQTAIFPEDAARVIAHVERAVRTGEYGTLEHRILRPDGEVRWIRCTAHVTMDHGLALRMIGTVADVTERRFLNEQMRISQKMDAVGQLTSGVAHNFNNMLAGMLPVLEIVEHQVPEPWRTRVVNARHAGERAAGMVRELMTFARPSSGRGKSREQLRGIVERAVSICREAIRAEVQIASDLGPADGEVLAHAAELEQVLVNIILNARDALKGVAGARLQVSVEHVPISDEILARLEPSFRESLGARLVARIRVVDNGIGMSSEVRDRIFEPFFTTKEVGQGTGLGLATAYAIVRDYGGAISCTSTLGLGTTFDVFLPLALPRKRTANARVLVVDDDATVRMVVAEVLKEHGFSVSMADSGQSAVEAFRADEPAVVMLDYAMPGMTGDLVALEMRRLDPRAKIVMFTGRVTFEVEQVHADAILAKPASAESIVETVRRALDE